ncbi:MAG TPA: G/U mismatch-specific DNA glycosylase [Tepidisphaeraceae bacterium]|nr:G/U mismatch-specific DNA glycosylase [Tepidisphaeraceae bacterium]
MRMPIVRPTRQQLLDVRNARVPDLIASGLKVLFVGINPSVYSAVVGHHFARPGNRFWPALHVAGLTPRVLRPDEEGEMLRLGFGITNVVDRATVAADELEPAEYVAGAKALARKVRRYAPRVVAFLGVGAYRTAFDRPQAPLGRQPQPVGAAIAWVLPNPSGLNAHYQLPALGRLYGELRTVWE